MNLETGLFAIGDMIDQLNAIQGTIKELPYELKDDFGKFNTSYLKNMNSLLSSAEQFEFDPEKQKDYRGILNSQWRGVTKIGLFDHLYLTEEEQLTENKTVEEQKKQIIDQFYTQVLNVFMAIRYENVFVKNTLGNNRVFTVKVNTNKSVLVNESKVNFLELHLQEVDNKGKKIKEDELLWPTDAAEKKGNADKNLPPAEKKVPIKSENTTQREASWWEKIWKKTPPTQKISRNPPAEPQKTALCRDDKFVKDVFDQIRHLQTYSLFENPSVLLIKDDKSVEQFRRDYTDINKRADCENLQSYINIYPKDYKLNELDLAEEVSIMKSFRLRKSKADLFIVVGNFVYDFTSCMNKYFGGFERFDSDLAKQHLSEFQCEMPEYKYKGTPEYELEFICMTNNELNEQLSILSGTILEFNYQQDVILKRNRDHIVTKITNRKLQDEWNTMENPKGKVKTDNGWCVKKGLPDPNQMIKKFFNLVKDSRPNEPNKQYVVKFSGNPDAEYSDKYPMIIETEDMKRSEAFGRRSEK